MEYLSEKNFCGTGTIRQNRTKKASLQEPTSRKKKLRGSFAEITDRDTGITLARWHDNSIAELV